MNSRSEPSDSLSHKPAVKRHAMPVLGALLFLVALTVLVFPISARAIYESQTLQGNPHSNADAALKQKTQNSKLKTQNSLLPSPPAGNKLGLPYETAPQPQPKSPERQGGPDAYGYIFDDDTEPGGPVYSWIPGADANRVSDSAWATVRNVYTTTARDDGVVTTTLPFSFNLYGTQYTQMHISTNGNLHFAAPNDWYPGQAGQCLPYNSPNGYVPL